MNIYAEVQNSSRILCLCIVNYTNVHIEIRKMRANKRLNINKNNVPTTYFVFVYFYWGLVQFYLIKSANCEA